MVPRSRLVMVRHAPRRQHCPCGMLVFVLIAVAVGAGTALSPCALPVLPALLSAGAAAGRRRPLGVVLGLSLTFLLSIIGGATCCATRAGRHGRCATSGSPCSPSPASRPSCRASATAWTARSRHSAASARSAWATASARAWSSARALGFVYAPCAGPVLAAVVAGLGGDGADGRRRGWPMRGLGARALRDRARRPARAGAAAPRGRAARAAGARGGDARDRASCSRRPRHALRDRARPPHLRPR